LFRPVGEDAEKSVWDVDSLTNFEKASWMAKKTDLVAQMPTEIFAG
jgi:hypothetical protein